MRKRTEPVQRSRRLRKTKKTSSVRAARLRGWVAGQAYRPREGAFLADLPLPQRGCGAPVNHAQATKAARRDVWVVLRETSLMDTGRKSGRQGVQFLRRSVQ